jgi:pyocin large subunit-like protein
MPIRATKDRKPDEATRQFVSRDGFLFKYDTVENDFLLVKPNGEIVTPCKPTDGMAYWERQVRIYDPNTE